MKSNIELEALKQIIENLNQLVKLSDDNYINLEDIGDAIGKVIHNLSIQERRDYTSGFNHELFHINHNEI